jgi:flagellar motor switch protein FliG
VALTGKQKAAMLLMSLDAATATELLKGVNPELVQELALELAHLDAVGYRSGKQGTQVARQFCNSLQDDERLHFKSLLKQMLGNAVGREREKRIRTQIKDLQKGKNPFARINVLDSKTIASVLSKEHPRTAAVVISELPAKKGSDVLELLGVGIRLSAVRRMHTCKNMTVEAKTHVAQKICERLDAVTEDKTDNALPTRPGRTLGKMALIVQKLGKGCRGALLRVIRAKDKKAGESLPTHFTQTQVSSSKIAWKDIPQIGDDLLQKALKGVDARRLALALVKADYALVQKITSNISESSAAALREQTLRISVARNEEVEEARVEIVRILHQMNERN